MRARSGCFGPRWATKSRRSAAARGVAERFASGDRPLCRVGRGAFSDGGDRCGPWACSHTKWGWARR